MATPKLENHDQVLVVEGYSDLLFFAELLERLGKAGRVFIQHFNGKSDLETKLETFINPGLLATKRKIAIIVDADADSTTTSRRMEVLLGRLTGQTLQAGNWTQGSPSLGLFIVPGAGQPGEIETLVWSAWSTDPSNHAARACIETYRDCMVRAGFQSRSPAKGLVSALLAIRNDDDPRLGPGARAMIFDFASPAFSPLSDFLRAF